MGHIGRRAVVVFAIGGAALPGLSVASATPARPSPAPAAQTALTPAAVAPSAAPITPKPPSPPGERSVTVTCPNLGTIVVALPSGVTNPPLPPEVTLSIGYQATVARTGATISGGPVPGDTVCTSVGFSNLTPSQISSGPAPAGVQPQDQLTGKWSISVTVNLAATAPDSFAAARARDQAKTQQTPSDFVNSLQSYLSTRGGSVSVAVFDAMTGATYTVNPQRSYVTASIVKADILATLLWRAQLAGRGLTSGEQATATQMIEVSDNNAATALWNEVGGAGGVATFNSNVPMPSTFPGSGGFWGLTRTTAVDQVALVKDIAYPNPLLGSGQRAYEQGLMENVTPSQKWGVSGGVPGVVHIALKNGWLPVSGGWEVNSIGHIFGGGKDYVIAVLTSGDPSMGYGITTIQGVSSLVWSGLPAPGSAAGPALVVAGNGNRYVFYKGGNGDLWQVIWNGTAWGGPYDIGMGPLGSDPAAVVDSAGKTYVFWTGGDGNLWEAFWTGTGWSGARLVAIGPLKSRPAAAMAASGAQYVFWTGPDGNLWQVIGLNGVGWGGPYDIGMGPIGSEPTAGVDTEGKTYVFWEGADRNLWEGFWTGTAWSGARFIGMGPLGSRPSVAVAANGAQYLFWRGADGNLWQAIGLNGAGWTGPYNQAMAPIGPEPSAAVDSKGSTYVVWKAGDNTLWEAYWTGSGWTGALNVGIRLN